MAHKGSEKKGQSQAGFTLIEMVGTLSVLAILLAMAIGGLTNYLSAKSVETSAREITSQIREAQAIAVATGSTYRLDFTTTDRTSYSLIRQNSTEVVKGPMSLEGDVKFTEAAVTAFGDGYMSFYSRGTSESGTLTIVGRFGKTKTIDIDGQTVNVSVS